MTEGPTRVRARPTVARYAKLQVTVTHGPDSGLTVDAAGSPVRIGTANDNTLVLSDDSVSRHHCELEPTEGGLRVRDTESTNGVLVRSVRVRDALVVGDAELTLGDTVIAVRWLDEAVDKEQAPGDRFGDLLGGSVKMRELYAQLERIAPTDYSLLLEGETGTGKDVAAESVHAASARADGPFVVLDCGAVAANLIESELFGHERGAFTGAAELHRGVFEQASGGTLFMDEIGELPLELQPKLLRVLEKRQLRRVGGHETIAVDVRIISATNRNLRAEVRHRRFREDLYYRLAPAHVQLPPLRDRLDDLEMLVGHFLSHERPPRRLADISDAVWTMLRSHRWPGNVRELRNAVHRLAFAPDQPFSDQHLRPPMTQSGQELTLREARRLATDVFERDYVRRVLSRAGGSVTGAAKLADVSRQMMQKLMRKHEISKTDSRR